MKALAVVLALALSAPSAHAGIIQKITVADLQNALDDANAQQPPDTRHSQCWAMLIPWVQAWQIANVLPSKPGLALLIQKTFDAKQLASKPLVPDNVVVACALTLSDINLSLAQFTAALGITAIAIPKLPL